MRYLSKKHFGWYTVLISIFALTLYLKNRTEIALRSGVADLPTIRSNESSYRAQQLKKYSFGFDNLIASVIWVNLLQIASLSRVPDERVSWEYSQLDGISLLDQNFLPTYQFGASFLSVFRRDKLGAKLLLEKWTKAQPTYWKPYYLLGYHLFFEMKDYQSAAPLMIKAAELPSAPLWLHSLGIRLFSESGKHSQALKLAIELFPSLPNPIARDRIILRIRSLRLALQLTVWNEALELFQKRFGRGPTSLSELSPLALDHARELASLSDATRVIPELVGPLSEQFSFFYDKTKSVVSVDSAKTPKELLVSGLIHHGFLEVD